MVSKWLINGMIVATVRVVSDCCFIQIGLDELEYCELDWEMHGGSGMVRMACDELGIAVDSVQRVPR